MSLFDVDPVPGYWREWDEMYDTRKKNPNDITYFDMGEEEDEEVESDDVCGVQDCE